MHDTTVYVVINAIAALDYQPCEGWEIGEYWLCMTQPYMLSLMLLQPLESKAWNTSHDWKYIGSGEPKTNANGRAESAMEKMIFAEISSRQTPCNGG